MLFTANNLSKNIISTQVYENKHCTQNTLGARQQQKRLQQWCHVTLIACAAKETDTSMLEINNILILFFSCYHIVCPVRSKRYKGAVPLSPNISN